MSALAHCAGCGVELSPPKKHNHRQKWCSERCRKRTLYSGVCVDCGALTSGDGGRSGAPRRCHACAPNARIFWTREALIGAMQAWNDTYGHAPVAADWNPGMAISKGHPEKAERFRAACGAWPHVDIVQKVFGSWAAGLSAAEFTPFSPGCYGRDGENPNLCREIAARYAAGESGTDLARAYGCHYHTIYERVRSVGGTIRTPAEAMRLKWAA